MSRVTLRVLSVGSRPLDKHLRLFLPDGTEIPNVSGLDAIELNHPNGGRVAIEISNCGLLEIDEPPAKETP